VFEQLEPHGEVVGLSSTPTDRAAVILAEAEERAAAIEEEARTAGFEAGRIEGLEEVRRELEEPRAALLASVGAVHASAGAAADASERRAVELALDLAERIVSAALEVRPELVCEVVSGALRRVVERDRLVLDLNPDDVPIVREWLAGDPVDVHPERRVSRGGCVVRTAEGELDAQIQTQLDRAAELVREALVEPA
jgi:flagellar biosynthesis/type III secretory pathway protein FliH